ncbi:DNA-binding protein [Lysinibacillus fusiformis]|nr:DNA-binding protein [Lysinibacillus fusiformis]
MLTKNTLQEKVEPNNFKGEWMDLKTAAAYLNVSYKTLRTFQIMGLEIVEIGRIRRVSKTALDTFMYKHSI